MATHERITAQRLTEWADILKAHQATPLILIAVTSFRDPARFVMCTPDGMRDDLKLDIMRTVYGCLAPVERDGLKRPG